jgi:hypothetical protein
MRVFFIGLRTMVIITMLFDYLLIETRIRARIIMASTEEPYFSKHGRHAGRHTLFYGWWSILVGIGTNAGGTCMHIA